MEERLERNRILYNTLSVVFKRKILLTTLCIISFILIIFFTFLQTPLYKATAKILIRPNPQQQLILFRDLATPGKEILRINPGDNLMQILTSQEMARQVVERFRLHERLRKKTEQPEISRDKIKIFLFEIAFYPVKIIKKIANLEEKEKNYFSHAVDKFFQDSEDIQLEENTDVINLSIWEQTPKLSSNIANYMAERLISKSTELEQTSAHNAFDFAKEQMKVAERTLIRAEDALLNYKKKEEIISLEEQKKAKLDDLQKLGEDYVSVKMALTEEREKLRKISEEISKQKKLLSSSAIPNNKVLSELKINLNTIEIQLAGELEKYSKTSSEIRSLTAQAAEGKDKLENELKEISKSDSAILQSIHPDLARDYIQILANIASLTAKKREFEKEMQKVKAESLSLSMKEIELERLNRNIETNEKLYKTLLDKFSELEVQKVSQFSGYDLKIIDPASVPEDANPDRPMWILVIILGFMGSILLSFLTVFFIEYWDESFKSPNEIEERIGFPVLCTVPDISKLKIQYQREDKD